MNSPLETAVLDLARTTLASAGLTAHEPLAGRCSHPGPLDRLATTLTAVFAVDVTAAELTGHVTVADVAARLAERRGAPRTPELRAGLVRRDGTGVEASFGQSGIWLIDQYLPHPAAYNGPFSVRLPFTADSDRMRAAVRGVLRRQDVLRTTYALRDGVLRQTVSEDDDAVEFEVARYGDDKELAALVHRVANLRLDLSRGPVVALTCAQGPDDRSALVCNIHHIASDAASAGIFLRELLDAYDRLGRGLPVEADPLRPTYADFSQWYRDRMTPDALARSLDQVADRLAGELPVLDLPTDRPRPPVQQHRGGAVPLRLPAALADDFEALARDAGVTLFMALVAAYAVFLARHTGQRRVLVGSPVSLRDDPATHDLIGYFVNLVVLRQEIDPGMTVRDVLRQAGEEVSRALRHKWVPFDKVVERLQPPRSSGYTPLVQTMLVLTQAGSGRITHGDGELRIERGASHGAKYDLSVVFERDAEGLHGLIEYDTHLFDEATAQAMGARLRYLMGQFVRLPDAPLHQLDALDQEERRTVLARGDRTAYAAHDAPVSELFEAQAAATPDAVALEDDGTALTYRELDRRANRLAQVLRASGARTGTRIGICLPRSHAMVVTLLAVLKTGAAYVPLDPSYPAQRLTHTLHDAGVSLTVTDTVLAGELPPGERLFVLDRHTERIAAAPATGLGRVKTPDDPVYVVHTSGSTGLPKGVVIADRTVANLVRAQDRCSPCGATGRTLQYMSLSFDVSVMEILGTLCAGGTLVLVPEELRKDLQALAGFLARRRITRVYLPYIALQQLAALAADGGPRLDDLREITSVGEALVVSPQIREFFTRHPAARLVNMYGPSETHLATWHPLTGPPADWPDTPPIGRPVDGVRLVVLDAHRRLVPPGVPGELYIGGSVLSPGYRNRPEETARRFLPDPFGEPGDRLYRTGDLVRWNAAGDLEYLGRTDDQIKIRGYRIEPAEIEAALDDLDGVASSAVAAVDIAPGDRRLVAVLEASRTWETAELRRAVSGTLPDYMVPALVVPVEHMPTTPSGKTDRRAVGELAVAQAHAARTAPAEPARPPRPGLEQRIAREWADVLKVSAVGRDEDFFTIGGNSIIATELVYRLRRSFGQELSLRALFDDPTVAGMAARLGTGTPAAAPALRADVTLPDGLPAVTGTPVPVAEARDVLLTGATGFLGSYLLRELTTRTGARVHCLVRAADEPDATRRLRATAGRYRLDGRIDWSRVRAVPGDLSRPGLGLSGPAYDTLAGTVDVVHHAAAHINFVLPYASVKPTNVEGFRHLVRFAATDRPKHLQYMSTIAVFAPGEAPAGAVLTEDDVPEACERLGIGYTQSKWVAERIALAARAHGIPVTIHRIGRISGDSVTGACQSDDFLWRQIKSFIELGSAPPAEDLFTDLLPVDFVARAVVALSRHPAAHNRTLHVFHPNGSDFSPVHAALRADGRPLEIVPTDAWLARLEESARGPGGNALAAAVPLFREGALELGDNTYHNAATTRLLTELGLTWPAIGEAAITRMIRYFRSTGELADD
ncbi:Linear gramicidin synthase subunit D [Streptomyces sp. RB17]|uniref:non-ribosomal peptide synthetase n=1 Tax=Streptomyces sp. RB17 TaxID=2585197 RepID=UPI0012952B2B|nr:non-ribosomal peptide synthetase [Streptomyces sp. RB17]MQY33685.1 Linear gramicidin synthase subunit D [Streptomyces sp. RB17]